MGSPTRTDEHLPKKTPKKLNSQKKKSKTNKCELHSEDEGGWAIMSDGDGSGGGSSCVSEDSDEEPTYSGSDSE